MKSPAGRRRDRVMFDCPWTGHRLDRNFVIVNRTQPGLEGRRCVKCGCLIYVMAEASNLVGPGGEALPAEAPAGFSGFPIREPQPDDPKES